ncbi:hypothetical protein HAX54_018010, partial [Datura stramonium]|nr:hypothetical protein [Datura stramonium]
RRPHLPHPLIFSLFSSLTVRPTTGNPHPRRTLVAPHPLTVATSNSGHCLVGKSPVQCRKTTCRRLLPRLRPSTSINAGNLLPRLYYRRQHLTKLPLPADLPLYQSFPFQPAKNYHRQKPCKYRPPSLPAAELSLHPSPSLNHHTTPP